MCFEAFSYMPLLTERDTLGIWGYKHVAPPEQEPRASRKKRVAEQEPRAKPQKTCGVIRGVTFTTNLFILCAFIIWFMNT
jgi:hypothetical protein